MAKNWTFSEAYKVIKEGKNDEAIGDIMRRFPRVGILMAKASMANNEAVDKLMDAFPDYVTARKQDVILRDGKQNESDVDEDEDVVEEKEEVKKPAEKKDKKPVKKKEEDEDSEEDEAPAYDEMDAVSLYKLCKKRKIDVEPKQKSSVYIKLLKAADVKAAKEAEDDEEDWGDEEEEEKPKKDVKGIVKQPVKAGKKKDEEEDDEGDWEI